MKNTTRATLAALALASLLGVTACGSTGNASPQGDTGAVSTPSAAANLPAGFTANFDTGGTKLPAEWVGGSGVEPATNAFIVGNYVGYDNAGSLVVLDGTGKTVYTSPKPDAASFTADDPSKKSVSLDRVSSNGHQYFVFIQRGTTKVDPSSTRSGQLAAFVVVVNDQGKEVSTQIVTGGTNGDKNGAVVVKGDVVEVHTTDTQDQIIDVATGKLAPIPNGPSGYEWFNRVDGVDLFVSEMKKSNGSGVDFPDATLAGGTWTTPTVSTLAGDNAWHTSEPSLFGSLLLVERPVDRQAQITLSAKHSFDLIDPHTGKTVMANFDRDSVRNSVSTSPNGKFILSDGGIQSSIFSVADSKMTTIDPTLNFRPDSVADDGYVIGTSNNKIAGGYILKGEEPKFLSGVTGTPPQVLGKIAVAGPYVVLQK